ncbi:MAG: NlpC/P60 family protein [Clostridiales bacterium]|nr:NlpC/P60 family protein [Clostridiales bacterium]
MDIRKILKEEDSEWSVEKYIDEKELKESIVDLEKQNQTALNESLLNGKYDGISGAPLDISQKGYIDIDAILKDEESKLSKDVTALSTSTKNTRAETATHIPAITTDTDISSGALGAALDSDFPFMSEDKKFSMAFTDVSSANAVKKTLDVAAHGQDLLSPHYSHLSDHKNDYDPGDSSAAFMAEYDAVAKTLELTSHVASHIENKTDELWETSVDKLIKENAQRKIVEAVINEKNGFENLSEDEKSIATKLGIVSDKIGDNEKTPSFLSDDIDGIEIESVVPSQQSMPLMPTGGGSVEALIDQLGIVNDTDSMTVTGNHNPDNLLLTGENDFENAPLFFAGEADLDTLTNQLGILSEPEVLGENHVEGIFETITDNNSIIVPDTQDLSSKNFVSMDKNRLIFDKDDSMMQTALERKLGIMSGNKKEYSIFSGLKDGAKQREKNIARERFKFMVGVLLNENKGDISTNSGVGRIVFGGAARRIGGAGAYVARRIVSALLPYLLIGLFCITLILGLLFGGFALIALPVVGGFSAMTRTGREMSVIEGPEYYTSDSDYVYNKAEDLMQDFLEEVESYNDGKNVINYLGNGTSYDTVWSYLICLDCQNFYDKDILIVDDPVESMTLTDIFNEMFYYTLTEVTDSEGHFLYYIVDVFKMDYKYWYNTAFFNGNINSDGEDEYAVICMVLEEAGITEPDGISDVIYTGGSPVEYVQWAIDIANDNTHGYSQNHRNGTPDYDCASLVAYSLRSVGINVAIFSTKYNEQDELLAHGFNRHRFKNVSDLQPGDILWRYGHTEIYVGNGLAVGAHIGQNKQINSGTELNPYGDQTGAEISVGSCSSNWTYYFRPNAALVDSDD